MIIPEFVDSGGKPIKGSSKNDQKLVTPGSNKLVIPGETTDQQVKTGRQPTLDYIKGYYPSYMSTGTRPSTNLYTETDVEPHDEDEDSDDIHPKGKSDWKSKNKKKTTLGEEKIKSMIEDIMSKRSYDTEIIDKVKVNSFDEIPSLDELKDENPILVRKVNNLSKVLNTVNGQVKGMILKSMFEQDLTDVPTDIKKQLINKLNRG